MTKPLSVLFIIWMLLSIVENILNIQQNQEHIQRQEVLDHRHQQLHDRLKIYEDLADPKTTQFYITELEKIVDNMHRLGKIIDKGEDIETYLKNLEEQINAIALVSEDHVNHMYNTYKELANDVDDLYDEQEGINNRLESHSFAIDAVNDDLHSKLDDMKATVQDIEIVLSQIENIHKSELWIHKFRKKIYGQIK